MKTTIKKIVDAQGIVIPQPLLAQAGLENGEVEITIENNAIVIRKPQKNVREGWAEASKSIADAEDDKLVWPDFANDDDIKLTW